MSHLAEIAGAILVIVVLGVGVYARLALGKDVRANWRSLLSSAGKHGLR